MGDRDILAPVREPDQSKWVMPLTRRVPQRRHGSRCDSQAELESPRQGLIPLRGSGQPSSACSETVRSTQAQAGSSSAAMPMTGAMISLGVPRKSWTMKSSTAKGGKPLLGKCDRRRCQTAIERPALRVRGSSRFVPRNRPPTGGRKHASRRKPAGDQRCEHNVRERRTRCFQVQRRDRSDGDWF